MRRFRTASADGPRRLRDLVIAATSAKDRERLWNRPSGSRKPAVAVAVPAQIARFAKRSTAYGVGATLLSRGAWNRGAVQQPDEFAAFVRLVRRRRLSVIVEIGTAKGGTLWAWCQLSDPAALIVSIDLPEGPFGGGYDSTLEPRLRAYARYRQDVVLIRGDSHSAETLSELQRVLGERKIDLLFIDGDHTYSGVRRDFETYSSLVADNGLIAFHDIVPGPDDAVGGVPAYWREIRERECVVEFVNDWDQCGCGIGVVVNGMTDEEGRSCRRTEYPPR